MTNTYSALCGDCPEKIYTDLHQRVSGFYCNKYNRELSGIDGYNHREASIVRWIGCPRGSPDYKEVANAIQ